MIYHSCVLYHFKNEHQNLKRPPYSNIAGPLEEHTGSAGISPQGPSPNTLALKPLPKYPGTEATPQIP